MCRTLILALLCLPGLSGCLSSGVAATTAPPELRVHAVEVPQSDPESSVNRLAFSPDGRYFLVARDHASVHLYRTGDTRLLTSYEDLESRPRPSILSAGFLGVNTYFIATLHSMPPVERRFGPDNLGREILDMSIRRVSVRSIEPPGEVASHVFPRGRDMQVKAKGRYFYYDEQLLDRDTGKVHAVPTAHPYGPRGTLTASGKVLTEAYGHAVLYDHVTDTVVHWRADDGRNDITASEKYAITHSNDGACTVWRLPAAESLGRCGYSWPLTKAFANVLAHPSAERFAVSLDGRVRVYDIEPFRLVFETQLDTKVHALALSPGNRLAVATEHGTIVVWNIDEARLLGMHHLPYLKGDYIPNESLQFSPDGRKLLTVAFGGQPPTASNVPVMLEIPD